MRYLIVNADDFGYSRSINRGILEAHDDGIVRSASLMVERPGAAEAAEEARARPQLDLGLHVEIDWWRVARLPRKGAARSAAAVEQRADADLQRQVARFRALVGRDPSHLDSHHNRHRAEFVRPAFQRLADELGVPLRHFDPTVRFCGEFYGHIGAGRPNPEAITPQALIDLLGRLSAGVTELCSHPGYAEGVKEWYREERVQEVRTLCDPRVQEAIERLQIELTSFSELAARADSQSAKA
jgi:chitin disaccharide deacetylase